MSPYSVHTLGDKAITIRLGSKIDRRANNLAVAFAAELDKEFGSDIQDLLCSYSSVTLFLSDWRVNQDDCLKRIHAVAKRIKPVADTRSDIPIKIPVNYDGQDLDAVAKWSKLSVAEVVRLHSQTIYRVFAIGFMPGFPYMGIVNPQIAMPRRGVPRSRVPAGAVAIAGPQTGIYPYSAPGGWNIVGSTDTTLFDHRKSPPVTLAVGQSVKFVPLNPN